MIQADIGTLKHYIDNGIKLIGAYEGRVLIAGGGNKDYKEAFMWFNKSAKKGNARA
ncbi:hypothetical protein AGMMS49936_11660 [Endomicrobiia bacterium]|nr:hypothetical protein AGMMS49936_11660 [Endomicrobiia bacterium]